MGGLSAVRRRPVLLGVAVGLAGLVVGLLPRTFALEERFGLGFLFAARGPIAAPEEVAVVGISGESARAVGQTVELDTWPRDLHAELVETLAAGGASAVVFDLRFDESREGRGDALFAAAIEKAGNVVLLDWTETKVVAIGNAAEARLEIETLKPPLPTLKAAALGTAPFVLPTVPISVGQFWTFGRASDDQPSLPAMAVQAHLLSHYEELVRLVERVRPGATAGWPQTRRAVQERRLGSTMTAIRRTFQADDSLGADGRRELGKGGYEPARAAALRVLLDMYAGPGSRYLNFYGAARAVTTLPYDRALRGGEHLAGKVVLVGLSEPHQPEQQDDFISAFSENTGVNLSGVELGATAIANLLERSAILPLPLPMHGAMLVLLGVALGVTIGRLSLRHAFVIAGIATAAYVAGAYWLFAAQHVWLPLVVPMLVQLPTTLGVTMWWSYRELAEQRERVRTALGYYVPQPLVRRLTEQTLAPGSDRELLHGTCLVTDAEQYTSIAEALPPDELAALMNDYFDAIFGVVKAHGGEISDTAGDSMVAVWASSRPDARTRERAARASLAILDAVARFNTAHAATPLPTRIGLESGEMLLGNIGGEQRYEYRAIGDIVNTASRIQGLNQELGTRVLISAATLDGVDLAARDVGTFLLRGKRLPVRVLEPRASCGLDDDALADFTAAVDLVRRGEWRDANAAFARLAARFPSDGPTRYYESLTRAMRDDPPRTWSGAVRVTAK